MKTILTLLALTLIALPVTATPPPPCVAITGAQVLTPRGLEKGLTVVIAGEGIRDVGKKAATAGCKTINGAGKILTPGLIDAFTHLGLMEITLEPGSGRANYAPKGDPKPVRATFLVSDAYNPNSTLIPIARLGGVTSAVVLPMGGVVSGRAAYVELTGRTQRRAVRRAPVGVAVRIGGGKRSRAYGLNTLRALLAKTKQYMLHGARWEKTSSRPLKGRATWRAMMPVLAKKLPLIVYADRASDIEALLRIQAKHGFKMIVAGGAEAWRLGAALAKAKVPVVIDPMLPGPGAFSQIHGLPQNAARLEKAGVTVILSSFSTHNVRKLRQAAGNAVREGLPRASALHAITSRPAKALGLSKVGHITRGARANLVLWSGDPLEIGSFPRAIWIGGVSQKLISRQTLLRDRYRRVPRPR